MEFRLHVPQTYFGNEGMLKLHKTHTVINKDYSQATHRDYHEIKNQILSNNRELKNDPNL